MQEVHKIGLLPSTDDAAAVASFLLKTPGLDKALIGEYISKGPVDRYPFNGEVLKEFCTSFSFAGSQFDTALRTFLLAFRLPGEAQCIDRLMEAFSAELFKQWRDHEAATRASAADAASDDASAPSRGGDGDSGGGGGGGAADGEDRSEWAGPFANADAVFVLSFSTIMLQTDLHNVGIPPEKKMKVEQFVNNNRGINKGANLPRDFLEALYASIAARPIAMDVDVEDLSGSGAAALLSADDPEPEDDDLSTGPDGGAHGIASNDSSGDLGKSPGKDTEKRRSAWDGLLEKRRLAVASASFTPSLAARKHAYTLPAGAHERDMFSSIADACISAVATAFVQTRDDVLVLKALRGFHQYARACVYFELDRPFNQLLVALFELGRKYVDAVSRQANGAGSAYSPDDEDSELATAPPKAALLDSAAWFEGIDAPHAPLYGSATATAAAATDDVGSAADLTSEPPSEESAALGQATHAAFGQTGAWHDGGATGSAAHRELLALRAALELVRAHGDRVSDDGWRGLAEILLALADAGALPRELATLHDFGGHDGSTYPASDFCVRCRRAADSAAAERRGQRCGRRRGGPRLLGLAAFGRVRRRGRGLGGGRAR